MNQQLTKTSLILNQENKDLWDAERLVKAYLEVAGSVQDHTPWRNLSVPVQVRLRRLAAVIRAYLDIRDNQIDMMSLIDSVFCHKENNDVMEISPISRENVREICTILKGALNNAWRPLIQNMEEMSVDQRVEMFWILLRYRIHVEYLRKTFSDILEANQNICLAVNVCSRLYNPSLEKNNQVLDRLLVLLLGSRFERVFTTEQLIFQYGYPRTTDEELDEEYAF